MQHFKACPRRYRTGALSAHSHVHTVHAQCNILLLATSAAFSFAGLQCMCLTAWCRYPLRKPGAGVLLQFPRKHVAQLPPIMPGSSTEASLKFIPHSRQRGVWNQDIGRTGINEAGWEFHLAKRSLIQEGEAASAVLPRHSHTRHVWAEEEIPTRAVGWVWMLPVPVAAIPFLSMFPWQPIHQACSSSARTCPLCFGPGGTSWRLSAPETTAPSHAFVCRAGAGSVGLGPADSQVSPPWDGMQVALLRWRVISERRRHAALSSPLTSPVFLGLPTINQWDVRLSMQIGNGRESLQEDESERESLMGGRHGIKILNGSGSLQRQRIPLPRKREEP